MFKEWKAIFKKPTFIIVMIGISLIPALYNIIFLSSMWDPYGKLSDLPVAVVNNDKEASYNGNSMACLLYTSKNFPQAVKNHPQCYQVLSTGWG